MTWASLEARAFMVGRPAELTGNKYTRRIGDPVRDDDLLHLVAECILDSFAQVLKLFGLLLASLLLVLRLLELETLLAHTDELLTIKLLKLSDGILVNGINQQESFEALLEYLEEWRVTDGCDRLAGEVVYSLLDLRHASDVVYKHDQRCVTGDTSVPAYPSG